MSESAPVRIGPNRELAGDGIVFGGISTSVSDLDRSIDFYHALGFAVGTPFDILPAYRPILGMADDSMVRAVYVKRDGVALELVETGSTSPAPPSGSFAAQLGLTHIRLCVDALSRVEALIQTCGGAVQDEARVAANGMVYVYCTDPDGMRILLSAAAES